MAKAFKVFPEDAIVRAGIQYADSRGLQRLLRLGGERSGEEAAS